MGVDLAIVGSGFGGSILAMVARRLGLRVALLERGRHPRFAIGESSSPLAGILIEQLADRYDLPRLKPLAAFGAFLGLWTRSFELNVFGQIGLVMLIGLAAKNAILIVEFAKLELESGKTLIDAALSGARLRLRPILMTSFAFILGCVPLWIASGAGAVSRQQLGTVVIMGMLIATLLGIFFVPVLFVIVERLAQRREPHGAAHPAAAPVTGGGE